MTADQESRFFLRHVLSAGLLPAAGAETSSQALAEPARRRGPAGAQGRWPHPRWPRNAARDPAGRPAAGQHDEAGSVFRQGRRRRAAGAEPRTTTRTPRADSAGRAPSSPPSIGAGVPASRHHERHRNREQRWTWAEGTRRGDWPAVACTNQVGRRVRPGTRSDAGWVVPALREDALRQRPAGPGLRAPMAPGPASAAGPPRGPRRPARLDALREPGRTAEGRDRRVAGRGQRGRGGASFYGLDARPAAARPSGPDDAEFAGGSLPRHRAAGTFEHGASVLQLRSDP